MPKGTVLAASSYVACGSFPRDGLDVGPVGNPGGIRWNGPSPPRLYHS
jgi:hypothetical protein